MSEKGKATAFLLCIFLGLLGVHRFYVRRWKSGLLMLATLGGLGIWWVVDAILVAAGMLRDSEGRSLRTGPSDSANLAAGFWVRLAAFSVDLAILLVIVGVAGLAIMLPLAGLAFTSSVEGEIPSVDQARQMKMMGVTLTAATIVLATLLTVVYFAGQHASRQRATIGKLCFDLRVSATNGTRLGLLRAAGRTLGYVVSALPLGLGFVMAAFTRDKRALHDLMADSRVHYTSKKKRGYPRRRRASALATPPAQPVDEPPAAPPPEEPEPAAADAAPPEDNGAHGSSATFIVIGVLLLAAAVAAALL